MNYELKDKINITKELLNELEAKSWQEIEHLQAQIANLAEGTTNNRLYQLFKNLLTSYYVFVGGIETLASEVNTATVNDSEELPAKEFKVTENPKTNAPETLALMNDIKEEDTDPGEVSEPFEYFVDFDEPIGDPITDKDLYNN